MDDLEHTPDAGFTIVQTNLDKAIDGKDVERKAIISMISILYTHKKITRDDIQKPLAEMVEFIDSFMIDSPNAMRYLGEMLAQFSRSSSC